MQNFVIKKLQNFIDNPCTRVFSGDIEIPMTQLYCLSVGKFYRKTENKNSSTIGCTSERRKFTQNDEKLKRQTCENSPSNGLKL